MGIITLENLLMRRLLIYFYFLCCIIGGLGADLFTQGLINSGAHIALQIPEEVVRDPFMGEYPPVPVDDNRPVIRLSIRDVAVSLMQARGIIRS